MPILQTSVRIPSLPVKALLVVLHAAASGPERKPLEDLARALARVSDSTWEETYRFAVQHKAEAFFMAGLAMRRRDGP